MINHLQSLVSQMKTPEAQRGSWSCPRSHSPAASTPETGAGRVEGKVKSRMLVGGRGGRQGRDAALRFQMDAGSCELTWGEVREMWFSEMDVDDFSNRSQP